jgi:hypothetical protein
VRAVAILLFSVVASALVPARATAHTRSLTYSSWELASGGVTVRVRVPELELLRLPPARIEGGTERGTGAYLAESLRLLAGEDPCSVPEAPRRVTRGEGFVVYQWRIECEDDVSLAIRSELFRGVVPSHLHFARIHLADGRVLERVLSEANPLWPLPRSEGADEGADSPATPRGGSTLAEYALLGVEHILTGFDHLAFVAALLLLAGSLRELAVLVTGFTVAHSVTLALGVLGVVRPEPAAVEALIGFSIALVGVENAWLLSGRDRLLPILVPGALLLFGLLALLGVGAVPPLALGGLALFASCHFGLLRRSARPAGLRAFVAFAFGLIHGFGFAGVLAELELPVQRLAPALFGFNAGVELGQLAFVFVAWPCLRLAARPAGGGVHRFLAEAGSAAVFALGLFWFVTRAIG